MKQCAVDTLFPQDISIHQFAVCHLVPTGSFYTTQRLVTLVPTGSLFTHYCPMCHVVPTGRLYTTLRCVPLGSHRMNLCNTAL